MHPDARNNLLLILYLYQNLPQYVPKTTIEFFGVLGQRVVKSIELRNPSKKAINYYVTLEGSSDFKVSSRQIVLEAGSAESFPIEFVSRFSKQVQARLMFRAQRDGGVNAATMVFNLQSAVHSREPVQTIQVKGSACEAIMTGYISNHFPDGSFKLSLTQDVMIKGRAIPAETFVRGAMRSGRRGRRGGGIGGKRRGKGGAFSVKNTLGGKEKSESTVLATPVHQLPAEIQETAFPMPFWCRTLSSRSSLAPALSFRCSSCRRSLVCIGASSSCWMSAWK